MNYSFILTQNTRDDDYVNATKLCTRFGKRWQHFKESNVTFLKQVELKTGKSAFTVTRKKDISGTYVHPLVAIKLAEWLSPEFDVYVKETFKRYLENDVTLADEIIQREDDPEKLKWIAVRTNGKITRRAFTDALQDRGVTKFGYGANTNAIYQPIFGKSAKELQTALDNSNPRDGMNMLELTAVSFAEQLAIQKMTLASAKGNNETKRCSQEAGIQVAGLLK
ncbi:KilA-N domain-containing protein [Nostoc sp. LPT]|uniref:KilA-N domain-containing protein n=1 Tax=Nostoc sp. LPT TaxID=2815387 RepID=UPI001D490B94|nr:KilA-N domain-containing protein [Nostoc sp. LPT]MBN4004802.1 KilA-N domain-containing protein [Nostoc sp. LPT]